MSSHSPGEAQPLARRRARSASAHQLRGVAARGPGREPDQHAAQHRGRASRASASISTACPFQRGQPARQHDRGTPSGSRQASREPRDPLAADRVGVERGGIDAARDDADAGRVDAVARRDRGRAMKWLIAITRSPRAITAL